MSIIVILPFSILCILHVCFDMFSGKELFNYGASLFVLWMILHIIVELIYKLYKGGKAK